MDIDLNQKKLSGNFLLVTTKYETQFYYIKNICVANVAGYNVYDVFDLINNENEKLQLFDIVVIALLALNPQTYTHRYGRDVSITYEIL